MTDAESWLVGTCDEILGRRVPSLLLSPIEAGMNSVMAVRLAALVSTRFDVDLNPAAVLRAPSLVSLVEGVLPRPPRQLDLPETDFVALSDMQMAFYVADELSGGGNAFHCPLAWKLGASLSPRTLDLALRDLAARHPLLRGTLSFEGDDLGFRMAEKTGSRLVRLRAADERSALARLREAIEEPLLADPDAPLWKAFLCTYGEAGEEGHFFVLMNHHMLVDWVSAQVLLRDLSEFYTRRESGEYPLVTATPLVRVLQERRRRDGEARHDSTAYWAEKLEALPEPPLKGGGPHRHDEIRLPAALTERLRRIALRQQCTLHSVLLSCFMAAYHAWTGEDDLVVGVSYAFPRSGLSSNVCAPLMNTLCIRTRLPPRWGDPAALLHDVAEQVLDGILHGELPVAKVAAAVTPARRGSPLFGVSFSYQENGAPALSLGVRSEPLLLPVRSMFPVVIAAEPRNDEIHVSATSCLPSGQGCGALLSRFAGFCEGLSGSR
ncbi:condensation domain-containing protein [Streptomyces populi]|uniref:condensation domain-containing protein n=1 Tax=Streptomyces populi TaxID=2058924 RepID=UPI0035DFA245